MRAIRARWPGVTARLARCQDGGVGRLDGKAAIITGGEGSIGMATARTFAAEGARVFLAGISEHDLRAGRGVARTRHGGPRLEGHGQRLAALRVADVLRTAVEHDPERGAAIGLLNDVLCPADKGVPEAVFGGDPQAVETAAIAAGRPVAPVAFPQPGEVLPG